ncbi:heparinase II/III domain-containing protein [Brachybacterium sp. AOP42-C2-15]|uniref:heparinase II/III domain-containing protein n=2 Tax=unclassified Brachybacterium TaxID=2623841 RepID=UPI00403330F3
MEMTSPLRTAWGLEVDAEDEHGVGPEAAARAVLPIKLSRALDGARERIPLPARPSVQLREAMTAPALASAADPLPFPLLSRYTRFWREGVRTDYEDEVRRLGIMTGEAVLAALATGEARWVDRAADGLMLLCELSTWCWVAHEQAHDLRGWVVPDPEAPIVDLGAAQTLQVIAWADLALGEELDERVPGLRQRLRWEARRRVFDPYLARRDWHWLHGAAHNWTGWIHQHLLTAALFLLEEESDRGTRDAVLALSIAQLDRYLASFPADGGIDEGFSYFWNGASRLLEAIDLLITASGGTLSRDAVTGIDVIARLLRYPQGMDLGGGWFVNVADGPARPPADELPWDVLHRWGRHLGADDVVAQALAHRGDRPIPRVQPQLGLGRVLTALGDKHWAAADSAGARPPYPARTWLPEVQLLVAREREGDPSGLALAAKGGHNDEAHNHLDVGSYLVALDGAPVLIDLGQPTYTALTFTDRRYEIWTMTSSWHNLPEIRGHQQGVGPEYRAREVTARLSRSAQGLSGTGSSASGSSTPDDQNRGATSTLELELAAAYPVEAGLRSYRRSISLDRGAGPGAEPGAVAGAVVRIEDTWLLDPVGPAERASAPDAPAVPAVPDVVLNHVIAGDPIDHRPGLLLVRAPSGALAEIRWAPALGSGTLERREIGDPLLAASWGAAVHRLRLTVADAGTATVTVRSAGSDAPR